MLYSCSILFLLLTAFRPTAQQDQVDEMVDSFLQEYPEISGLIYSWTLSALSGNSQLSQSIQGRLFSSLIGLNNNAVSQSDPIILGPDQSDDSIQQAATFFDSISQLDRFQCLPRILCSAAAGLIAPPTRSTTTTPVTPAPPPGVVLPPSPPIRPIIQPPAPVGGSILPPAPPVGSVGLISPPSPPFSGSFGSGNSVLPPSPPQAVSPPGISTFGSSQSFIGSSGSRPIVQPPGFFPASSSGAAIAVGPPAIPSPPGFTPASTPGPPFDNSPLISSPIFAEPPLPPSRAPFPNRFTNRFSTRRRSQDFSRRNNRSRPRATFRRMIFPENKKLRNIPYQIRSNFTNNNYRSQIRFTNPIPNSYPQSFYNISIPEYHSPFSRNQQRDIYSSRTNPFISNSRPSRRRGRSGTTKQSSQVRFPQRRRRRKRFVDTVNSVLSVFDSITRPYSFHPLTHAVLMGGMHESRDTCARLYWRCPTTRDQMLDVVNNLNAYFPTGGASIIPPVKIPALDAFLANG